MPERTAQENSLSKVEPRAINERARRVCVVGLIELETTDSEIVRLKRDLLSEHTVRSDDRVTKRKCSIGGCGVLAATTAGGALEVTGECVADTYCLKEKFEASGDDALTGKQQCEAYEEIMDTTLGYGGGNFCPRFDCNLSAGFSIDGIGGTAGECVVDIRPSASRA